VYEKELGIACNLNHSALTARARKKLLLQYDELARFEDNQ